ncbi:MAG: hypothetical protein OEY56_12495 [Cyclobacteriaceae bacterium]|nr:hypothetical protein [Cyclobacteriaceae bacterium]
MKSTERRWLSRRYGLHLSERLPHTMPTSFIPLLQKRIEKLDAPDFDLEAWKSATHSILERALGPAHPLTRQVDQLKIDYGSWALRDATSRYNPVATSRTKGRELLEVAIDELTQLESMEAHEAAHLLDLFPEELQAKLRSTSAADIYGVLMKEKKGLLARILASQLQK